jgi:hypothetical protein
LTSFLPAAENPLRLRILVELVKVDQEQRWCRGDFRPVEAYLVDWPELGNEPNVLAELIGAECLTGGLLGQMPNFKQLRARFPKLCEYVPLAEIRAEVEGELGLQQRSAAQRRAL